MGGGGGGGGGWDGLGVVGLTVSRSESAKNSRRTAANPQSRAFGSFWAVGGNVLVSDTDSVALVSLCAIFGQR